MCSYTAIFSARRAWIISYIFHTQYTRTRDEKRRVNDSFISSETTFR